MKSKIKNLIHDLIIGRDAPAGTFKNKQINDFFVRARELMYREPHVCFAINEFESDGKTVRDVFFRSTTLGTIIHITVHSKGDDHEFPVFIYDSFEDFS